MVTKKQYQTRLDPDDAEAVEEYAEDHGVTDAEAVRRLIKAGLDVEQHDDDDDRLDPDEIREDLRALREEQERTTTTMNQMDARKIGALALAVGVVAYVATHLPPVGTLGLFLLLVVGVALVAYGAAPLLQDTPDDDTDDDAVNRTTA